MVELGSGSWTEHSHERQSVPYYSQLPQTGENTVQYTETVHLSVSLAVSISLASNSDLERLVKQADDSTGTILSQAQQNM